VRSDTFFVSTTFLFNPHCAAEVVLVARDGNDGIGIVKNFEAKRCKRVQILPNKATRFAKMWLASFKLVSWTDNAG